MRFSVWLLRNWFVFFTNLICVFTKLKVNKPYIIYRLNLFAFPNPSSSSCHILAILLSIVEINRFDLWHRNFPIIITVNPSIIIWFYCNLWNKGWVLQTFFSSRVNFLTSKKTNNWILALLSFYTVDYKTYQFLNKCRPRGQLYLMSIHLFLSIGILLVQVFL